MALRGNLRDFSLPDVFQLVQLSKKTGVLRIKRSDAEGSIWFRDGEVFFAQSDWNREPLGQRLVNAGRITPSALAKAIEIRSQEPAGGRRLGQILVDEGYITQPVLEAFVQEQIQDTIFDLMRWDEGEFDFEILPEVVDEDIGLSVSVENIVMEGSRRIEEWNRIKKKVPSMDMVFKMATAPGEGTFEISLKPTEWNLLLLTDGTRSVAELARDLGKTDFEVARVIYGLFSAGLLEVASDDEVERLRAERAEREARRAAQAAEAAKLQAAAATAAPEPAVPAPAAPETEVLAAPEPAVEAAPEPEATQAEAAEAPAAPPREPVEEPEFLAGPKAAPSADDMAVFEQVMGAVLKPHPEPAGVEVPEEQAAPVIELPTEEQSITADFEAPAAAPEVSAPPQEVEAVPQATAEPVAEEAVLGPAIEELQPTWPETSLAEMPLEAEPVAAAGPISPAELGEIPVAPVLEEEAQSVEQPPVPPTPSFVPTGDLEKDLLALGLGELPAEEQEISEPLGTVEAEEPAASEALGTQDAGEPAVREPLGAQEAGQPAVEQVSTDAVLSELLRSLGGEEETTASSEPDEAPKVISTDAYLAEFESDVTLTSALTDEITALTGGGTSRPRPTATVTKLPEPGEQPSIHRDRLVDRDLVLKIIDGIEKL
ncbi:MAG: DUF4388 domain-containing protein [Anaerosomatales bacterium]|nr:DUF4388 domain-containing protein [Anaerosomatales bacterium]